MRNKLIIIFLSIILYWLLVKYIPYGFYITYPITLLVTFFHETGHAFFALISGGSVHGIQINSNGSGYALISEGCSLLVIPGGYIGSAIWGNILLYVSLYKEKYSRLLIFLIMGILVFVGIYWFSSVFTSILLFVMAVILGYINFKKTKYTPPILLILGSTSLAYIIMDFYGGPSSDLAKFTGLIPIFPPIIWAIIWLSVVIYITYLNLKRSFR